MELKELKKEIDGLARVDRALGNFRKAWLKQIKPGTNSRFPFLQELDEETKREINQLLASSQPVFRQLAYGRFTQEKLSSLAQYLIELKLASLNGDEKKPRVLVKKFLEDDFLNLKLLVEEVKQFEFDLNSLKQVYERTNQLLIGKLPLEHSLAFHDPPHKNQLNLLLLASKKQKQLLKILGKEFIYLAKEMKRKKKL